MNVDVVIYAGFAPSPNIMFRSALNTLISLLDVADIGDVNLIWFSCWETLSQFSLLSNQK